MFESFRWTKMFGNIQEQRERFKHASYGSPETDPANGQAPRQADKTISKQRRNAVISPGSIHIFRKFSSEKQFTLHNFQHRYT